MTTPTGAQPTRLLYYGDNLEVLRNRQWFPDESVDLVYLDPPFKSQQDYNVLFRTQKGTPATAQVQAFTDTWRWDAAALAQYEALVSEPLVPGRVAQMVQAFHQFLGPSEMMAYLVMMTPRLLELHRVLKPTGSLYLHCDPAASHYLKLVLDTIFGPTNFRDEVVWKRSTPHGNVSKRYGAIHDLLLFYTKADDYVWNPVRTSLSDEYVATGYRYVEPGTGRRYQLTSLLNPNPNRPNLTYEFPPGSGIVRVWRWTREKMEEEWQEGRVVLPPNGKVVRWKRYLDEQEGRDVQDVWTDIQAAVGSERLGYPTQKPVALLRRVIEASSNPGDLVLDPFCGCGTAVVAAEELGRSWIGIDITYLAIDVMARRLRDHFPNIPFEVRGQPRDVEGAMALAQRDRFQFQFWALSLVGAQALGPDRRGPDRGIDGYLPFQTGQGVERAVVQVKSGHVGVSDVRDLHGTMRREKAECGLLITLEPPTPAMHKEAVEAGSYLPPGAGASVPRIEIVTVEDLLVQGKRPALARYAPGPMPQAPRLRRRGGRQLALGGERDEEAERGE